MRQTCSATKRVLIRIFCIVAMLPCLRTGALAGGITESVSSFNIGPEGGDFLSLVADNQNPGTLYVGGRNNGVFKTADGGASWHPAGLAGLGVTALVIDQKTSTLYALAGFDNSEGGFNGVKVFKSNGGASWTPVTSGLLSECSPTGLAADPQHSATLYVLACANVFKSTDGGETWNPASNGLPGLSGARLAVAPQNSNIIYVVTNQCDQSGKRPPPACDSRIFRTVDGADNWSEATLTPLAGYLGEALVVDPRDDDTLYLHVTWTGGLGAKNGVSKSVDGGRTWSTPTAYGPSVFGSYFALAIDPRNPSTIYVSSFGVFKSTDGGQSWATIYPDIYPYFAAIVVDPQTPGTIFGAVSSGIIKSTDEGANWTVLRSGLRALSITAAAIDPQSPDTLYAGTYVGNDGTGLFKSTDRGRTWAAASAGIKFDYYGGNKVVTLAIDPQTPSNLYAGVNGDEGCGSLFKSVDGGMNWSVTGPMYSCPLAVVIDPQNPSTVYAATWDSGVGYGVLKSIDAGATWTSVGFGKRISAVTALALDPQNSQTLYAGVLTFAIGTSTLFKSTDGGSTWNATTLSVPKGTISEVTIDLQNPSTVYVATAILGNIGSVWKSVDGGASWLDLSPGLPYGASAVAVDPKQSATIYATTGLGVMMSTDGGETWAPLASDIVTAQFVLRDPKSDETLYAGGPGGLFEIARSSVTALTFDVNSVRVGGAFVATIAGSNLNNMYFDVQVLNSGAESDEYWNWQMGTSASHSVPAGISTGTWAIFGVRPHQDPESHTGSFVPVYTTITVSPY